MSNIKLFESKKIRSTWNEKDQKWFFSVQDVIEVLTDSADVKQYIKKILSRDEMLKSNWGTICTLVEMEAADGKKRKVQAADAKGLLRIIQSIPSPKAEPFKLWLSLITELQKFGLSHLRIVEESFRQHTIYIGSYAYKKDNKTAKISPQLIAEINNCSSSAEIYAKVLQNMNK